MLKKAVDKGPDDKRPSWKELGVHVDLTRPWVIVTSLNGLVAYEV